jgi:hypothetical protein
MPVIRFLITGWVAYRRNEGEFDRDRSTFIRVCLDSVDRDLLAMRAEIDQLPNATVLLDELDRIKALARKISIDYFIATHLAEPMSCPSSNYLDNLPDACRKSSNADRQT